MPVLGLNLAFHSDVFILRSSLTSVHCSLAPHTADSLFLNSNIADWKRLNEHEISRLQEGLEDQNSSKSLNFAEANLDSP